MDWDPECEDDGEERNTCADKSLRRQGEGAASQEAVGHDGEDKTDTPKRPPPEDGKPQDDDGGDSQERWRRHAINKLQKLVKKKDGAARFRPTWGHMGRRSGIFGGTPIRKQTPQRAAEGRQDVDVRIPHIKLGRGGPRVATVATRGRSRPPRWSRVARCSWRLPGGSASSWPAAPPRRCPS